MVRVRIDGIEREYPADATWQQVAGDYQDSFENDILPVSYTHLDVYKRQPICGVEQDSCRGTMRFPIPRWVMGLCALRIVCRNKP